MAKDWRDVNREFDKEIPLGHDPFVENEFGMKYCHRPNRVRVWNDIQEQQARQRQALTPRQRRMLKRRG